MAKQHLRKEPMVISLEAGSIMCPQKNTADLNDIFWILRKWAKEQRVRNKNMKNIVELRWRLLVKVFLMMWAENCNLGFVKTKPLANPGDFQLEITILNKKNLNIGLTLKLIRTVPLSLRVLSSDKICKMIRKEEDLDTLGLPEILLPNLKEWVNWNSWNIHNVECVRIRDNNELDEGPVWNYTASLKMFAKHPQEIGKNPNKVIEERLEFLDKFGDYMRRNIPEEDYIEVEIGTSDEMDDNEENNEIEQNESREQTLEEVIKEAVKEALSETTEEEFLAEEKENIPWTRERAYCKARNRWRQCK